MDETWLQPGENNHDAKLAVRFFMHPRLNKMKTDQAGRPIYEDAEYIEITTPGDKSNIPSKPVLDIHRKRFRKQYEAFKSGKAEQLSGTPLAEWPLVTRSQVEELAHFKIRTVEQLATVSDGNALNIGPIMALRQRAADWLEKAGGNAVESRLRSTIDKQSSELDALRKQVEELGAKLEPKNKNGKAA